MAAERTYLRAYLSFRWISDKGAYRFIRWVSAATIAFLVFLPALAGRAQQDTTFENVVSTQQHLYLPLVQSTERAASLVHAAEEQENPTPFCALYPIALPALALANLAAGDQIDLRQGDQPDNFGWLAWSGSQDEAALVASLTPPGNAHTFVYPHDAAGHDPADIIVSVGDWVRGLPTVENSEAVRNALDPLLASDITAPVWGAVAGAGSYLNYQMTGFARVRVVDYQLEGESLISVLFLNDAVDCQQNQPPVANDDIYHTIANQPLTVAGPGILGNDRDVEGDPIAIVEVGEPLHGALVQNLDGSFQYTPAPDFCGADHYAYRIADDNGDTTDASVTLVVACAGSHGASNLVSNSDFAEGDLSWNFHSSTGLATATFDEGLFTASLPEELDPSPNIQLYQTGLNLRNDASYTLSFDVQTTQAGTLRVRLLKHTPPYTNLGLRQTVMLTPDSRPQMISLHNIRVEQFSGNAADARIMFAFNEFTDASISIDNVRLEEEGFNLITNGDFAQHSHGWNHYSDRGELLIGYQPQEKTTTISVPGPFPGRANVQFYQLGFPLQQGKEYRLSFHAGLSQGGGDLGVHIQNHDIDASDPSRAYRTLGLNVRQTLTATMRHYSYDFVADQINGSQTQDTRLRFDLQYLAGATLTLHNVTLIQIQAGSEPPPEPPPAEPEPEPPPSEPEPTSTPTPPPPPPAPTPTPSPVVGSGEGFCTDLEMPAPARVEGGTLRTATGQLLRGEHLLITNFTQKRIAGQTFWNDMKSYGFNTVRLLAYQENKGVPHYICGPDQCMTVDEIIPLMDLAVRNAARHGLYAIIDYHALHISYNITAAQAWWLRIADRYKNCTHVIYEVINESGAAPDVYNANRIRHQEILYDLIRNTVGAQDTPLIFWSVTHAKGEPYYANAMLQAVRTSDRRFGGRIDYSNAVVGFHAYGYSQSKHECPHNDYAWHGSERLCIHNFGLATTLIANGYAVMMTEMERTERPDECRVANPPIGCPPRDWGNGNYNAEVQRMEELGISWILLKAYPATDTNRYENRNYITDGDPPLNITW